MRRVVITMTRRWGRQWAALGLTAASAVLVGCAAGNETPPAPSPTPAPSSITVLFVNAHPDDETLFGLGRFRERGWTIDVALVTNGEGGGVVEAVRSTPAKDGEVLVEKDPAPGVHVVSTPPSGPAGAAIVTKVDLAKERRGEFLDTLGKQGVSHVFFLSDLRRSDYEDSWDNGIRNWDIPTLKRQLTTISDQVQPDVVVTLNPGERWAHKQHQGIGRIVRDLWRAGDLDARNGVRPALYGLREHGWYRRSLRPQNGDEEFDRTAFSPALDRTYADQWTWATSSYVSQSSHPVWFAARAEARVLPGYGSVDIIRRLVPLPADRRLTALLASAPPLAGVPPASPPEVTNLSGSR